MADDTKELQIKITSDTSDGEEGLNKMSGAVSALGGAAEVTAGIIGANLVGSIVDLGKHLLTDSIDAFMENEREMVKLDTILKNTGDAIGITRDQFVDMADKLSMTTQFTDNQILKAEDMLLIYDKIGKEIFPQVTQAALDLATFKGIDPSAAAMALGRALESPAQGVGTLGRIGIKFSEDQQKMIKALADTGKTAEAQDLILQKVKGTIGGLAQNEGKTLEGQMKLIGNAFEKTNQIIGSQINTAILPYATKLRELVQIIPSVLDGHVKLNNTIKELSTTIPSVGAAMNLLNTMYKTFATIATQAFTTVNKLWLDHKKEILAAIKDILPQVNGFLTSLFNLYSMYFQQIGQVVSAALNLIEGYWKTFGADIIMEIKGALEILLNTFKAAFDLIIGVEKIFSDLFKGDWKKLWNDVKSLTSSLLEDIKGIIKGFADFVMGILNGIIHTIQSIPSAIASATSAIGHRATGGFASGLTLVGERGPELVALPSGSYVYNNQDTNRIMGGGGGNSITIQVNNPSIRSDNDIRLLADQIAKILGRQNELARLGAY